MIEQDEISQILHQLGVEFNLTRSSDELAVFDIPQFGTRVIYSVPYLESDEDDWYVVIAFPKHDVREVRENIIWAMAKGGFFNYLRTEYPNTFKQMLAGRSGEDWHQKIIKKRLEFFGDKPKYQYYRELNETYLRESSMAILSVDEGFYDIIY